MLESFTVDSEKILAIAEWRILVKARAGWKCERCGSEGDTTFLPGSTLKPKKLHAHHKDHRGDRYPDMNNILANGECLCHPCHADEHRKPKKIKAVFGSPEHVALRKATEALHGVNRSEVADKGWATRRLRQSRGDS